MEEPLTQPGAEASSSASGRAVAGFPESSDSPAHALKVPHEVFLALMEAAEASGPHANPHRLLFHAGRQWGFADERGRDHSPMEPREALLTAIGRLPSRGLARAELIEFRYTWGGNDCFISCRLTPPEEVAEMNPRKPQDRPFYLLAAGYLTGWLASMTGIDVTCRPLGCAGVLSEFCCSFEARSLPSEAGVPWEQEQCKSTSHFILDAVEGSLSGRDLALEDLVESMPDTVMFLDLEDKIQFWSRGAVAMFQYQRDEIVGLGVSILFPEALVRDGELERLKADCVREGVVHNFVTRRLRKDGEEIWVSLTRAALHDYRGEPLGAVAILRDVTEQRTREQEHRRSKHLAMMGELAATVAHEVKNPLTGIYSALQVLEGQLDTDDPRREIFASIGGEVMRLNDFAQGLLAFARPTVPRLVTTDLGVFLEDLVRDLEHISLSTPGRVILELHGRLSARIDRDLTGRVFKNLILNAIQAMPAKGSVRVRGERREGRLIIDVADSGPGIPAKLREKVFEPFFTTKTKGTGLGLAISKKIVEAQGGTIRLRSERSSGATFRIEFPVA